MIQPFSSARRACAHGRRGRASLFVALCLIALSLLAATPAAASNITGTVTDAVTGLPVSDVYVQCCGLDGYAVSTTGVDVSGDYTVNVSDGTYRMHFHTAFYVDEWYADKPDLASSDVIVVAGEPVTGIDAGLSPAPHGHISGRVTDQDGAPLPGAMVSACAIAGENWNTAYHTYTADDGTYSLTVTPDTYGLCFDKYRYDRVYYDQVHTPAEGTLFTVNDGDSPTGMDGMLTLQPKAVTAWAQNLDGTMLTGIRVDVLDATDESVVAATGVTGADGTVLLDLNGVEQTTFKIRYSDPGGTYATCFEGGDTFEYASWRSIDHGGTPTSAAYLWLAQRGEIKGRTLDQAGNPVPNVEVHAQMLEDAPYWQYLTTSDENGVYSLSNLKVAYDTSFELRFSTIGEWTHFTQTTDYEHRVGVAAGESVTFDSSLEPRCSIAGTLTCAGEPVAGIAVEVFDSADNNIAYSITDAQGRYAVTGLHTGEYRLQFQGDSLGYRDEYFDDAASLAEATPVALTAAAPQATIDHTLVPWGRIRGQVESELAPYMLLGNIEVTLYDGDGHVLASTTSDPWGHFEFADLDLGTYYLGCVDIDDEYLPEFYDDAAMLAAATPLQLTDAQPRVEPRSYLATPNGVDPEPGTEPDGSLTVPSRTLGIKAWSTCYSQPTLLAVGQGLKKGCYFFEQTWAGWAQRQVLAFPDAGDGFGRASAIDGDTAVVTDYYDDGSHTATGSVLVFRRVGEVWTQATTIVPDAAWGDGACGFGRSVAVSGDTILVGAPRASVDGNASAGAAYVYVRTGDEWSLQQRIVDDTPEVEDRFGWSVGLHGDTAAIGADQKDTPAGIDAGSVEILTRSDSVWSPQSPLVASDSASYGCFGEALTVGPGRIVVGAPRQEYGAGAVYVFEPGSGGWTETAKLSAPDGQPDDAFGRTVSLDGDTLLIGAPLAGWSDTGWQAGAAYLFDLRGGVWCPDAEFAEPAITNLLIGQTVTVAGRDLFVGVPNEANGHGDKGTIRIYAPYATEAGAPLVCDSSRGVLVNDRGPKGAFVSMQLESQPAHGTLDANSEGAFTYTPEAGFVGTDTFLYRAVSSGWLSEPTLVSILVRDATAPTVGALAPQKWVNKQVTVTLTATDDSDVAALEYRDATDVPWIEYIDPFAVTAQGKTSFGIRSRDIFGNAKRSGFAVRIDTVKPVPRAPYTASVTSGGTCRLRYRINDARPGSPDARVVITIKNAGGRVVWTRSYFGKPVNQALKASFRCHLARGAYRFFVTCMDTAGNRQSKAAVNRLTVR